MRVLVRSINIDKNDKNGSSTETKVSLDPHVEMSGEKKRKKKVFEGVCFQWVKEHVERKKTCVC